MNVKSVGRLLYLPSELDGETKSYIMKSFPGRLRTGVALTVLFIITSILPDLYLDIEVFYKLLALKSAALPLCFLMYCYLLKPVSLEKATLVFYILVMAGATVAGGMIYVTGGCGSHWALASGLVIFLAVSVSNLPSRAIVITTAIGVLGYLVPVLAHGHFSHSPLLTYSHLFLYAGFSVMAVSVSRLQFNLVRQTVDEIGKIKSFTAALEEREMELVRINEDLKAKTQAALEQNKLREEFLANISHELRTPLTSIMGFAGLLERRASLFPDSEQQMLNRIQSQGRVLLDLIDNLVELSSMSGNQIILAKRPMRIFLALSNAVDALRQDINIKGHTVEVLGAPHLGEVNGDHERLTQAITHLLKNAIKFTPYGAGKISCGCKENEGFVEVFIKDNGPGIDPEKLGIIFEMFRQADGSSTRRHGGTGIGLPIVKRIIELHGGQIHVETSQGKGANFIFTIPKVPSGSLA